MCKINLFGKYITMELTLVRSIFIFSIYLLRQEAGCDTIGSGPPLEEGENYLLGSAKNLGKALVDQPDNKNSSIKYWVFTPGNPKTPCFIEPNEEALKNCPVDSSIPTIFLIHGFITDLNPGNMFELIKDALLDKEPCTVIFVDWSKYDGPPYELAIKNVMVIGGKVADLIKYLMEHAGITKENVTIIGHSLGAHMGGAIGKHLPNLFRIVGLDPAGPYFETPIPTRLTYKDANYVQVLHSSNELFNGLGLGEAIGHIDYYVNGGVRQPHCHYGNRYRRPSGDEVTVDNPLLKISCHHEILLSYYVDSINQTDCKFLATECGSYQDFKKSKCPPESSKVADMGFYGDRIQDMPPLSTFYIRTRSKSPYCL